MRVCRIVYHRKKFSCFEFGALWHSACNRSQSEVDPLMRTHCCLPERRCSPTGSAPCPPPAAMVSVVLAWYSPYRTSCYTLQPGNMLLSPPQTFDRRTLSYSRGIATWIWLWILADGLVKSECFWAWSMMSCKGMTASPVHATPSWNEVIALFFTSLLFPPLTCIMLNDAINLYWSVGDERNGAVWCVNDDDNDLMKHPQLLLQVLIK